MPSSKPKKSPKKKNLKPEVSYKVIAKKTPVVKAKPKKKTRSILKSKLYKNLNQNKFFIAGILLVIFIIVFTWVSVSNSISHTIDSYNSTQEVAKSFMTVDKNQVSTASVVGSDLQLSKEISNFQSAPEDLRAFALKDYRAFKGNCVVNGKLIGPVDYKIESVVYDQFSRVKRTCISNDSAIVAKISGKWTIILSGNSLPECSVVNAFNLPQGISFNCTDGLVIYTNPNP